MTTDALILERRDGGAFITINRPHARNAVTRDILPTLSSMIAEVEADESLRFLVFQGKGEHFSAGGDVKGFEESLALGPVERQRAFELRVLSGSDAFIRLAQLSIPVVSIVRGAAAGAGLVFVLAADFAIASDDAFFVFAHAQLGIAQDLGTSYFLPRVVGVRKARQLSLTAARLSAQEALDLGIVSHVVPGAELEVRAAELLAKIARGPGRALRETKKLLNVSLDNSIAEQVVLESRAVGRTVASDDFAEGVRAFLERRKPHFRG